MSVATVDDWIRQSREEREAKVSTEDEERKRCVQQLKAAMREWHTLYEQGGYGIKDVFDSLVKSLDPNERYE